MIFQLPMLAFGRVNSLLVSGNGYNLGCFVSPHLKGWIWDICLKGLQRPFLLTSKKEVLNPSK